MKKKIVTIISIILLLVLMFSSAYAIISLGYTFEDLDITANVSDKIAFTATGGGNFTIKIDSSMMNKPESDSVVASTTDNVNLTLDTDGQDKICCSYDLTWNWNETDNTKNQYIISTGATREFVITGTNITSYINEGNTLDMPQENNFSEQVPNYNDTNKVLYSGTICNYNEEVIYNKTRQSYTIESEIYNLLQNQDALKETSFSGKLMTENIKCNKAS